MTYIFECIDDILLRTGKHACCDLTASSRSGRRAKMSDERQAVHVCEPVIPIKLFTYTNSDQQGVSERSVLTPCMKYKQEVVSYWLSAVNTKWKGCLG